MTYPLNDSSRNSNESFTDSKEVPYSVQHEYVLQSWKRHGIAPNPNHLKKRELFLGINSTLHELSYKGFTIANLETLEKKVEELNKH